jgi:hypothetical protein
MATKPKDQPVYFLGADDDVYELVGSNVTITVDGHEWAKLMQILGVSNNYRRYHGGRAVRWRKLCTKN